MDRSQRVAARWRLFQAMSLQQAKETLGFKPTESPSPDEIVKAYRKKTIENHPDRGGSHEKMVEVNVAKEILDGKRSPGGNNSYTSRPSTYNSPPPERPKREPPKVVKTIEGESFSQAVSKAGIPSNIDWKCVSKPVYADRPGQRAWNSYIWTLIGVTDQKVFVVSFKLRRDNNWFDPDLGGLVDLKEDWQANIVSTTKNPTGLKSLPKLVRSPSVLFEDGTVADPPKKWETFEGGSLSENAVKKTKGGSGGATLNAILEMTGLMAAKEGLGSRKSIVEIIPHYSPERGKRVRAENGGRLYTYQAFEYEVRLNGKSAPLADDTITNLDKNGFLMAVFSMDPHDNVPKQLHRLRGGRWRAGPDVAIRLLADSLTSEPSWLHIALEKAAEEYE